MDSHPIGVFDSGVGGLTVVKELIRELPNEDIIYFGDTARVPYGTKSRETIIKFSLENILFLLKRNVKLIVVACNTSSSIALPEIKNHFSIPLVGVIRPGVKEAIKNTRNRRIGVIGTRATINSKAYDKEIKSFNKRIKVFTKSCPLFVPLVEEGILDGKIATEVVKMHIASLRNKRIDTLILGCTHYPLLKTAISKVMGSSVKLIDSAKEVAKEVKEILEAEKLLNTSANNRRIFYVTDEPRGFAKTASLFLGKNKIIVKRAQNV